MLASLFQERLLPIARELLHQSWIPGPRAKRLLAAAHRARFLAGEAFEWGVRSLVATPSFLSLCAAHGDRIAVDRVPYIAGRPRLELGSNIRISGLIAICARSSGRPVLRIGSGVYIAHGTTFAVADRVEVGDHSSIGADCYIADTDGHSHSRLDVPIWEDPAEPDSVAPVIIEDNVHIARGCVILKGVRIGARSLIGAHTVVRSDVAPGSVIIGNPGRPAGWRRATVTAPPCGPESGVASANRRVAAGDEPPPLARRVEA